MHQRAIPLDDFPEVDLFAINIRREVIDLIPRPLAHEHAVIPVNRIARKLVVALADPTDQQAIDARDNSYGRAIANLQMVRSLNKSSKPPVTSSGSSRIAR